MKGNKDYFLLSFGVSQTGLLWRYYVQLVDVQNGYENEPLSGFQEVWNTSLTVSEASPPKLTPVTQVSEGAQVRLQCSVPVPCSSLPPSITWHLGNNPIHGQSQKQHVTFMAQVWASFDWSTFFSFLFFNGAICDIHHCLISGNKKLVCKARVWLGLNIYLGLCPVWSPYIHMLTVFCILVSILRFPWSHIGRS